MHLNLVCGFVAQPLLLKLIAIYSTIVHISYKMTSPSKHSLTTYLTLGIFRSTLKSWARSNCSLPSFGVTKTTISLSV